MVASLLVGWVLVSVPAAFIVGSLLRRADRRHAPAASAPQPGSQSHAA